MIAKVVAVNRSENNYLIGLTAQVLTKKYTNPYNQEVVQARIWVDGKWQIHNLEVKNIMYEKNVLALLKTSVDKTKKKA